jgi:hypothetical protein
LESREIAKKNWLKAKCNSKEGAKLIKMSKKDLA